MTRAVRRYLTLGIALLGASGIVAVSTPSAVAEGGAGGTGGGTITGPGGTPVGAVSGTVTGLENVPGGAPGTLGCLTGACSASLSTVVGVVAGPSAPVYGSPGLQITPTVNLPQPNVIACLTAICHGNGGLNTSGGVTTPIVGATGGLNGYIHG